MRVKIKGEITPERMAQAMEEALKYVATVDPHVQSFGANVYLNLFNADGESISIVNARREPVILTIDAPSEAKVRPVLSDEAKQRRKAAREQHQQRQLENEERGRQQEAEYKRKRQHEAAQAARAQITLDALNDLTSQLLLSHSKALIDGLNGAVRTTWEAHEPKETYGPRKGEPKPMPVFSTADGRLVLSTPAWKNPRWLRNAIGYHREGWVAPIWTFSAWVTAVSGFLRVMESLSGPLPDAITTGPLWPELLLQS
ncbi:OfxX fusion product [Pseudomonas sp. UBA5666]|uniref:OfxX fusion product n=1 Tax=Pseudomonas sp. UBA5666 TaxID=1947320 RepID=UPI0025958178|nr:OfxX fusion product [Pseudomonas sp. UBA5666]